MYIKYVLVHDNLPVISRVVLIYSSLHVLSLMLRYFAATGNEIRMNVKPRCTVKLGPGQLEYVILK